MGHMSIENTGGTESRGPSRAAVERAFQFKLDKESVENRLLTRYAEVKEEMSAIVERLNLANALIEKITNPASKEKMKKEAGKMDMELRNQLVSLREEKQELETAMDAKSIEYRVQ